MKKCMYIETIRIIAILCVIFNHTGEHGYLLFQSNTNTYVTVLSLIISNLCKMGVPLFFMISGVLLLPKQESLKNLFFKRIFRLVIILILFSFIYYIRLYIQHPEYGFGIGFFLKSIFSAPFITPFWFLYSYLAFLLMLPMLRRMVQTMKISEFIYFVIGAFLLQFVIKIFESKLSASVNISIPLFSTNILYPVLGYFIAYCLPEHFECKRNNILMGVMILLNEICCVIMTFLYTVDNGLLSIDYVEKFTLIPTIAVFYFIKQLYGMNTFNNKFIVYIGSCTFCIYLFEEMLRIDIFMKLLSRISPSMLSLLLCIPYSLALFGSGILISTVLKRIPIINRLKL